MKFDPLLILFLFFTSGHVVSKIHDPENYSPALEKEHKDDQFCTSGWKYLDHTKKCYKHFSSTSSWTEAWESCEALFPDSASTLASAPNKVTNDFVSSLTSERAWIGGFKSSDGSWSWTDGSKWTGFVSWEDGEPNNLGGVEDKLETNFHDWHGPGLWNDMNDMNDLYTLGHICQYYQAEDELLVIVGGYGDGVKLSSVEMIGDNPCSIADFPHAITGHVAVLTPDGLPLVCGSSDNPDPHDCYKYDVSSNQWSLHSTMKHSRPYASAVSLPSGVYVLGGYGHQWEMEFLPKGSTEWEEKDAMIIDIAENCAVPLSDQSFLMINYQDIYEYNIEYETWTSHHDLDTNRDSYACGIVNNKLVVAGGTSDDDSTEDNVEVIDLASWDNSHSDHNLHKGRHDPGYGVVNGEFYVFGGTNGGTLDSIEKWDQDSESFTTLDQKLKHGRGNMAMFTAKRSQICG